MNGQELAERIRVMNTQELAAFAEWLTTKGVDAYLPPICVGGLFEIIEIAGDAGYIEFRNGCGEWRPLYELDPIPGYYCPSYRLITDDEPPFIIDALAWSQNHGRERGFIIRKGMFS